MNATALDVTPPWMMTASQLEREKKSLTETTYSNFFETFLDKVAMGQPIAQIMMEDPRDISPARYLTWIRRDPARQQRLVEAQEIGAEMMASEIMTIADGLTNPEDVARSQLRVSSRFKLMGFRDRKKFGDIKQVDINTNHTVDMRALLELREQRLNSLSYSPTQMIEDATLVEDDSLST